MDINLDLFNIRRPQSKVSAIEVNGSTGHDGSNCNAVAIQSAEAV